MASLDWGKEVMALGCHLEAWTGAGQDPHCLVGIIQLCWPAPTETIRDSDWGKQWGP